ncbi:hypothetical protein L3Q82_011056 [Scortum barcoo]|uniref:Uncharacterized protein n=1 Tax=Scortum barcoo TaxID=214431 RepID=A0ACB8W9U9_9TELE|nr:hypothetical protein L3Q82_011056 [Scortum barcoo]
MCQEKHARTFIRGPQHTLDQVTSTERDEVSDKERQRAQRKRNTPIDCTGSLVWFLGRYSEVVRCGPLSPQRPSGQQELTQTVKEKERDEKEKERQAVITKTTTVWFGDGSLGENRRVIRSGWARCCRATLENLFYTCVTVQPSVTEM